MQILKILGALLHYPDQALQAATPELRELLAADSLLREPERRDLTDFVLRLQEGDLLDLQSEYVATFDRGRKLSLHLFEHVHGESRDRGQAMADLLAQYRAIGLELAVKELPDYLPLFLEYCSLLPEEEGREQLGEIGHLLELLHARLQERDSPYAVLFHPLLRIAGVEEISGAVRNRVAAEERDDTPQALDRAWDETPVSFGLETEPCPSASRTHASATVQWVHRPRAADISS
jgi:nitrate reductase delta subunit